MINVLDRIDELRKQRGWSINYLAMESGLTQSTVNNMFVRKTEPKLSTLRSICDAFGITLSTFFYEESTSTIDKDLIINIQNLSEANKLALLQIVKSMS